MNTPKVAGYGSWKSPITSNLISSGSKILDVQIEIDDDDIYWVEMRPTEAGRYVIVRRSHDGGTSDVTPNPYNVRTRVHEYGGGAYKVERGVVYFSNFSDQRLYRQVAGFNPEPITPEGSIRYADSVVDTRRERIICVCQDHTNNNKEPENYLTAIDSRGKKTVQKLVSGNDFYSSPQVSPDGSQLAWLTWNHPNMPWDYTELWVGDIEEEGTISSPIRLVGGSEESICQPKYAPDGVLYFVSEKTGWWNLYRCRDGLIEPLCEMDAEFGVPHWVFSQSTYGFTSARQLICIYFKNGVSRLASINTETLKFKTIDTPYTSIASIKVASGYVVLHAGSPTEATAIVRLELATSKTEVLCHSTEAITESGYLSLPDAIDFATEGGLTAHAFYYRPKNSDFIGPDDERPPLIVISHGGPTGATSSVLNLVIQYWTSRGFAVADVDYGGSKE